jgi:hypothetical protein
MRQIDSAIRLVGLVMMSYASFELSGWPGLALFIGWCFKEMTDD